jgi:hypothetical protein
MGAYDLVPGIDWLERFSPMTCNWLEKWLEFQYNGSLIRLQGITSAPSNELQEVSVEQVLKWSKGNDLWAVVLLEPSSKISSLADQHILSGYILILKTSSMIMIVFFRNPVHCLHLGLMIMLFP